MDSKDFLSKVQSLLLDTDFVERCVTFDGGEALQVKTVDGEVFNVGARKRDLKKFSALVNQRSPRYRRENMGFNLNLVKNEEMLKCLEKKLREEEEFYQENFGERSGINDVKTGSEEE